MARVCLCFFIGAECGLEEEDVAVSTSLPAASRLHTTDGDDGKEAAVCDALHLVCVVVA